MVDVVGYPQPTFSWKKDGKSVDVTKGRYSQSSKGTVSIRDVEKADKGKYTVKIVQTPKSLDLDIDVIAFGKLNNCLDSAQEMVLLNHISVCF